MTWIWVSLLLGLGLAISLLARCRWSPSALPPDSEPMSDPLDIDDSNGGEAPSASPASFFSLPASAHCQLPSALLTSPSGFGPFSPATSPPSPTTSSLLPTPSFLPLPEGTSSFLLDLQKILAAFQLILQAFGRSSPALARPYRDNFLHDLALILQQDLPSLALDIIDSHQNVLLRYHVLSQPPKQPCLRDPAYGIELPLLPTSFIASHRIGLGPLYRFHAYAPRLRDSWYTSPPRRTLTPNQFLSKYLQLLLNHRITARVFVSDLARRTGFIQEVAPDGRFAFASCADLNAPVFLHPSECDQLTPFLIGQPVSFVLIHTPRGFQGRNIRPA